MTLPFELHGLSQKQPGVSSNMHPQPHGVETICLVFG